MRKSRVSAGVAAGHPATVEAGLRVLVEGGNAVDAAVAATFASCATETILCGLGGGGFATVFSADSGSVAVLDFFCAVPGLDGGVAGPMVPVEVYFGEVPIDYEIGGASVAVPGVPAGCAELHRRFGSLPWAEIVRPAYELARSGAPIPVPQAEALHSIRAAMTIGDGARAYAPTGRLLEGGDLLLHPGLADAFALLGTGIDEWDGHTRPLIADGVRAAGGALGRRDLADYRVISRPVRSATLAGRHVCGRLDLNRTLPTFAALPEISALSRPERAVALAKTLRDNGHRPASATEAVFDVEPEGHDFDPPPREPLRRGETTNISVVDRHGNACVVTHTLGLGSGVWLPGLGVHLNSMLGEGELVAGDLAAGDRVHSMMSPLVVLAPGGQLELAIGAAGASRIRSALLSTLVPYLVDGRSVPAAVGTPRLHVAENTAHLEPNYPAADEEALVGAGFEIERWEKTHHFFGAVSAVGRGGVAGDPRRGGAARAYPA
ncbi:gamma-glutamyltransferase [Hamadaea tsunoensis]|uniref:gamma-glutamyltransferase n=1 Tax=Hamadaea tsunoensis TaxID=53368 RepID=UPI000480CE6F|nr:gamma-glutamyltransferase [Hamadaea tsunoensis]